ncbi:unnamed protein product [Dracunculus medinensis]|uniref:Transposase n=1 Tax=Dracunculus medinensis TaxID=318479 RepID=A0A0N4U9C9_DRAME|nr:unnamed protein product [Dracunculus medinensis]
MELIHNNADASTNRLAIDTTIPLRQKKHHKRASKKTPYELDIVLSSVSICDIYGTDLRDLTISSAFGLNRNTAFVLEQYQSISDR